MTTNQYSYNGDGQRVQIVDSQGTKKPIWDFQNILLETDGSDATQVVYTLEPAGYGNLVSQRRGSTTSFYLFDARFNSQAYRVRRHGHRQPRIQCLRRTT